MDLASLLPVRTAADSLRGLARFTLGGQEYILPTLPIEANEEWLRQIEGETAGLLRGMGEAGDELPEIITLLMSKMSTLVEMLKAYDAGDHLPSIQEIRRVAQPHEVLFAVITIWRAANPLVDIGLLALMGMNGPSSGLTNLLSTNGPVSDRPGSSDDSSRPSNSSASSTPQAIASARAQRKPSRTSGPGPSLPTTDAPTTDGAPTNSDGAAA